jgi:hypothetical protein
MRAWKGLSGLGSQGSRSRDWTAGWVSLWLSFGLSFGLSLWLSLGTPAMAETLTDRLAQYPHWQHKPTTTIAQGDLYYPNWLAGTWHLKTTLIDMVAPLAPEIITPGFESNRELLNQAIEFDVRFSPSVLPVSKQVLEQPRIVADRAFNGLNIAKAYLGENFVRAVKVDPSNPNRQITILKNDRQLESSITDRAVETPDSQHFATTELFQQIFRGTDRPYLNQVETTTAYHRLDAPSPLGVPIEADQVTAIYLSPNDENYFKANEIPVALYRYKLEFFPLQTAISGNQKPNITTIP